MAFEPVYEGENPVDAHLVANFLQANGLHPRVEHDQLWSVAVEVLTTPGVLPTVKVPQVEAETARQLIEQWRNDNSAGEAPGWQCPKCGADNEGCFSLCWQCGHRLTTGDNE